MKNLQQCLTLVLAMLAHQVFAFQTEPVDELSELAPLYPKIGIGTSLGWDMPYGLGLEVSYLLQDRMDIHVGVGRGLLALRATVGTRVFFNRTGFSPFVGANLSYSSGNERASANFLSFGGFSSDSPPVYYLPQNLAIAPRVGIAYQWKHFSLLGNVGYAVRLFGFNPVLIDGNPSALNYKLLRLLDIGGLELSTSFIYRF